MQTISIRPLSSEDASQFQSLRLAALRDAPQAFGASYEEEQLVTLAEWARRLQPGPGRAVFGAWQGERLVGSAGLLRMAPLKQLHKAMIWGVYVAPTQRGGGLGRRLMAAALEEAGRWEGVRQALLTVAEDNAAAQRLYESLGFVAYGREPAALQVGGRYIAETLMIRTL